MADLSVPDQATAPRRPRLGLILAACAMLGVTFFAGVRYQEFSKPTGAEAANRPLYYACPMHPGYRSELPGDAPCCGMRLEPVFAGGMGAATAAHSDHLQIDSSRRQLAGIRVEPVSRRGVRHTLRTTGRVAPDENRIFRINAATEMWIRGLYPPTTGSRVAKNQPLCGFYTTNFLSAGQSFLYLLNATDALAKAGQNNSAQNASNDLQLRQAIELLQNIGVSDAQIEQIRQSRTLPNLVEVRSPVAGYILSRKVTLGQWLGSGSELYEIADLSHVWIYADLHESEARAFQPGHAVRVWSPTLKMALSAAVSDAPPAFDATTRLSRVRLELNNPDRALWPGMFVDVELPLEAPEGLAVPYDAVVFSGKQKTVYVEHGNGFFEPRAVETGVSAGDYIQVTSGLSEGERIAVSASFLLDSESRLRRASAAPAQKPAPPAKTGRDPICGMDVDPAAPGGLWSDYDGARYYFCSKSCKASFDKEPARYAPKKSAPAKPAQNAAMPEAERRG
ncbi:MAG: efflux RND transporter periplasmic adaptor subunit [Acidobacteria bacterium]|nr:efflux RND transporter periplasmic adaptor subunit [Acidobacteriota bacterium]